MSSNLNRQDLLSLDPCFEYRILGCSVYNLYNVINGSFYSFENNKGANVWDILPGLNLAIENKLVVTVNNQIYDGELLTPNQKYRFKISQE
jgi:myo-inositol-1(or 4)-monophosphatase